MARYHQGKFHPKHPEKYKGDVNNIWFRSGWELRFFHYMDDNPNVIYWNSEELIIPYFDEYDKRWHRYFPDATVQVRKKDGSTETVVFEIKPSAQRKPPVFKPGRNGQKRYLMESATYIKNQCKWKAAEEWCLDKNWKFQLISEKDLGIDR